MAVHRIDPRAWYAGFDPSVFVTEPASRLPVLQKLRTAQRTLRWGPYELWARAALRQLTSVHEVSPVDVVWAIHGDDSCHEIAFRFHRATGVPWVADFKDAWDLFHSRLARPVQFAATWRRLATAAALTETSHRQAELDVRFHRPTHVVWSGYDSELMERAKPQRVSDSFHLLHVGNLSALHDLDYLASALLALNSEFGKPIPLHLFGYCSDALRASLERHGAQNLVIFHPFVDRARAFGLLRAADMLLLLPATAKGEAYGQVGVKELEYLASGTPVLTLGKLLPEIAEIAGPQVIQATCERDVLEAVRRELDTREPHRSSVRVGVNSAAVLAHAWPSKAQALADVLSKAAVR